MSLFIPKPPVFEARPYTGDPVSDLDIQGWLLSQGVDSEIQEIDSDVEGETIKSVTFAGKELKVGQWLFLDPTDGFVIMEADALYKQYTQV